MSENAGLVEPVVPVLAEETAVELSEPRRKGRRVLRETMMTVILTSQRPKQRRALNLLRRLPSKGEIRRESRAATRTQLLRPGQILIPSKCSMPFAALFPRLSQIRYAVESHRKEGRTSRSVLMETCSKVVSRTAVMLRSVPVIRKRLVLMSLQDPILTQYFDQEC